MGFLDNLENDLKRLESQDEGLEQQIRKRERREAERAEAIAAEPYADKLKDGPYTAGLLSKVTRIGHAQRTKVRFAWIGRTLRLEAKNRKLELRPTPEGVVAMFHQDGTEVGSEEVDLNRDPAELARKWLSGHSE